jgi:hypothetical protein
MAAGAEQFIHGVEHLSYSIQAHAPHRAIGFAGPFHFGAVDVGVVDLRAIMVFGGHPEHRHHGLFRGGKCARQFDHVQQFERHIERTGEEVELVACGNGERVRLGEEVEVTPYFRLNAHARILAFQRGAQRLSRCGIEGAGVGGIR